jgi:hypothetical protein
MCKSFNDITWNIKKKNKKKNKQTKKHDFHICAVFNIVTGVEVIEQLVTDEVETIDKIYHVLLVIL